MLDVSEILLTVLLLRHQNLTIKTIESRYVLILPKNLANFTNILPVEGILLGLLLLKKKLKCLSYDVEGPYSNPADYWNFST